ncbi:MAG: hypothetical protein L0G46_01310 [Kocuria sp.]|nr:hypothetical protein [Kocuria sp.]
MRTFLGIHLTEVAEAVWVTWRTVQRWETTHTPSVQAEAWLIGKWEQARQDVDAVIEYVEHLRQEHGPAETIDLAIARNVSAAPGGSDGRTPSQQQALQAMIAFEAADTAAEADRHESEIGFTVTYARATNLTG